MFPKSTSLISTGKKLQTQNTVESTAKFADERYQVETLWSEPETNLPNNYDSDVNQIKSLE